MSAPYIEVTNYVGDVLYIMVDGADGLELLLQGGALANIPQRQSGRTRKVEQAKPKKG